MSRKHVRNTQCGHEDPQLEADFASWTIRQTLIRKRSCRFTGSSADLSSKSIRAEKIERFTVSGSFRCYLQLSPSSSPEGLDVKGLRTMKRFYQGFPIQDALRLECSWTHYPILLWGEGVDPASCDLLGVHRK